MSFPDFSNFSGYALNTIESRKGNTFEVSKLNCWVKITSGASGGCVLYSNPNIKLFSAAGDNGAATVYGNKSQSGIIGTTWGGTPIISGVGAAGRPHPIVTSLEIDEGAGELSRKAKFTIRCFTIEQLNSIMGYYMEPGFTVFIEFGWNTPSGLKVVNKLSAGTIASYQSIKAVEQFRSKSTGHAEVYLGFITGGSVNVTETYWDVNVKVSGFSELPAYFMAADNQRNKGVPVDAKPEVEDYTVEGWFANESLVPSRWRMSFNSLPSNKKTKLVKALEQDKRITNPVNWVNFDPKITDDVNTKRGGSWFGKLFGGNDDGEIQVVGADGSEINVPVADDVRLIGEERFIRFEALHRIMYRIENKAYKLGGKATIPFAIDSSRTICSAFENIFSTDRTKLFIPNPKTPGPSYYEIATGATKSTEVQWVDNTVKYGDATVIFPSNQAISDGKVKNIWGDAIDVYYGFEGSAKLQKDANTWGFLNDLYINFDFAKGILETKNFLVKDALYQILNGISAAAGGMWDFQIQEVPNPQTGLMELRILEMNCINKKSEPEKVATFQLSGPDSVFLEASFDMDIGGAMMNQVIGEKNSKSLNSSSPSVQGNLFSKNLKDEVGIAIVEEQEKGQASTAPNTSKNDLPTEGTELGDDYEKQVKEQFAAFLGKVCLAPHVTVKPGEGEWGEDPYKNNYLCAYDDQAWFEVFKIGAEPKSAGEVSILLPIKFTFTVHGVSGLKRGDKFIVLGLPQQYSDSGFFQVTAVKHVVSGMLWKTEVTGQFRQTR